MAPLPRPFVIAYAAAVGAVVGSFLNVVVHRLPRGRSVVRPGSACPACETPIRWYDNVPVLSWLLLRGRCRRCGAAIALRYPLIEAAGALIAALAIARSGLSLVTLEVAVFAWVSLALGAIDLEHQILPDVLTYPSLAFGLGCAALGGLTTLSDALLGAAFGAAIPAVVIVVYRVWRGEEGMGWGDVKYLAAIGAVVGLRACMAVLVVAAVLGSLVGVGLIVSGRGSRKSALPFGTFLAAAVILWLYAPPVWRGLIAP